MKIHVVKSLTCAFAMLIAGTTYGQTQVPNTFQSGQPAMAADVNANFSELESAANQNAADIATNAADVSSNASDIAAMGISTQTAIDANSMSMTYQAAPSPVYGEKNVVLQYRSLDLLWRPARGLIRFVFVKHPTRGNLILLTTHLELDPLEVIALYGARFKIEVGFKEAKYTIGAQAYHFWMADMKPVRKGSGNQYLHHESGIYRDHVQRKMDAYHRYASLARITRR